MTARDEVGEEVISAAATEVGVSVMIQRGAVIGLELILADEEES